MHPKDTKKDLKHKASSCGSGKVGGVSTQCQGTKETVCAAHESLPKQYGHKSVLHLER